VKVGQGVRVGRDGAAGALAHALSNASMVRNPTTPIHRFIAARLLEVVHATSILAQTPPRCKTACSSTVVCGSARHKARGSATAWEQRPGTESYQPDLH